jgi:AraC-like DNA-binding protein
VNSRSDSCLRFRPAAAFEVVQADHLAVEQDGITRVRMSGESFLLFSVQGDCFVRTCQGDLSVGANEALLQPAVRQEIVLRCPSAAELYVLRFRQLRLRKDTPQRKLAVPDHVSVLRPGRLTHLLRWLTDEVRRPRPSRAILHHLVVLALCELACSSHVSDTAEEKEAGRENIASRVDAYIAAHYHERIGTLEIARDLRFNPDYLERVFRRERHLSIREAVNARRIKEARAQLLLQGKQGVAEIAALCGYSDLGYFRRVFKRATNMTPREYRIRRTAQLGGTAVGPVRGSDR